MRIPDGRRFCFAPSGIRTKWPSWRGTPFLSYHINRYFRRLKLLKMIYISCLEEPLVHTNSLLWDLRRQNLHHHHHLKKNWFSCASDFKLKFFSWNFQLRNFTWNYRRYHNRMYHLVISWTDVVPPIEFLILHQWSISQIWAIQYGPNTNQI